MALEREPAAQRCLHQTRAAVLALMALSIVSVGLGIWWASHLAQGRPRIDPGAGNLAYAALIALVVASFVFRRGLAGRQALADPETRAGRFFNGHVLSAAMGPLAALLGIALAWAARPEPRELTPFWVAAVALGLLAYPRGYELDDLDRPKPDPQPEDSP